MSIGRGRNLVTEAHVRMAISYSSNTNCAICGSVRSDEKVYSISTDTYRPNSTSTTKPRARRPRPISETDFRSRLQIKITMPISIMPYARYSIENWSSMMAVLSWQSYDGNNQQSRAIENPQAARPSWSGFCAFVSRTTEELQLIARRGIQS